VWYKKLCLSRFDRILERDGQTDGRTNGRTDRQTDRIAISLPRASVLTRDKIKTLAVDRTDV